MLRQTLLHPQLLGTLAALGHGSKVLVADGNYPFLTGANPTAVRVFLNVEPGVLTVDQVVGPLLSAVPIESAAVMVPPDDTPVEAHDGYRAMLGTAVPFEKLARTAFYDRSREPDVGLVVATCDLRVYANLLLTIGVRTET